ncbi:CLUMA_CG006557, isoform A [Clunio marinus]|uniref:CLUMA_CG006557, isoform A n=1 Tax=Clunio marinus TaxID=568069 RepID=A0A1J1HYX0_9DIPT|nr:CLUMA_CG006557, isoform A [Clunio marinus]
MILIFLSVLAILGGTLGQRNPNPCEGVTGTDTFVNDYTSCADYFWCNNDVAINAGPCPDGFIFNGDSQTCVFGDVCDECPTDGTTLAVGLAGDTTCTFWQWCSAGVRSNDTEQCNTPLLFNRGLGLCDLAESVNCVTGGPGVTPSCPPTGIVDIEAPPGCNTFFVCIDGDNDGIVRNCTSDLHFNPQIGNCDLPENRVPLCEDPAAAFRYVPTVLVEY